MDINLLKTFIEVNRTKHFGHAANNLFLTQSAVSARIKLMEEELGTQLFTRTRNDIQLTPPGQSFLKYAESIVNTWNRARQDIVIENRNAFPLNIGGLFSLYEIVLQEWLNTIVSSRPDMAVSAEANTHDYLARKLEDNILDLVFLFEPPQISSFIEQEIATIKLVMVTSEVGQARHQGNHYIYVDWGTAFSIQHSRLFPALTEPRLRVSHGRMALMYMLSHGGSAYMAEDMVTEYIQDGTLHLCADTPVIERKAYAIYSENSLKKEVLEKLLAISFNQQ